MKKKKLLKAVWIFMSIIVSLSMVFAFSFAQAF